MYERLESVSSKRGNGFLLAVVLGILTLTVLMIFNSQVTEENRVPRKLHNVSADSPPSYAVDCETKKERFNECSFRKLIAANSKPIGPPIAGDLPLTRLCDEKPELCLKKWGFVETYMRAADEYNFGACVVPKTMSTVMGTMECYLRDWFKDKEYPPNCRQCEEHIPGFLYMNMTDYMRDHFSDSNWTTVFVKRDPVDRFISGFLDRCVRLAGECNHCYMNVTCFMEQQLHEFQLKTDSSVYYEDEFHMVPQSWMCNLRELKDSGKLHFVRYSTNASEAFLPDMMELMDNKGVPSEAVQAIFGKVSRYHTTHSTVQSPERTYISEYIRSQPYIQELIIRLYHNDYNTLGYAYPNTDSDEQPK